MREIIIDTETTGLDPLSGHRVVEIGAVELVEHAPTGRTFHCYLNPERAVPADAVAVHGLTAEFLADKPPFDYVADEFLAFVGDAPLVAHNAGFDIVFLNAELKRAGKPAIAPERVIDTLVLARRKHAGGLTLDDLCARYGVDRSRRSKHGALFESAGLYVRWRTRLHAGHRPCREHWAMGLKLVRVPTEMMLQWQGSPIYVVPYPKYQMSE
jgi:DNA polymerase III subunit epsilon